MLLSTYSRNKLPSIPYSIVMLPSRTTGLPVCIPVQIHECCLELVELLRALMPSAGIQTVQLCGCQRTYNGKKGI